MGHLVNMTIEKDYADEDQQVPDSTNKQEAQTVAVPARKPSLPDFETLLDDLVEVGALDAEELNEAKNGNMELAYSDRSFYDDYAMQQIKREDNKDYYAYGGAPEYVTSDLGFLSEDSAYGYTYSQMQSESLDSTVDLETASFGEKEVIQKIERASMELGISKNPYQWKPEHTHRWAEWTLKLYNIGGPVEFYLDGTSVCMLSLEDFRQRCCDYGDYLHAELELWKSAFSFISSPIHSDEEDTMRYQPLDDLSVLPPLNQQQSIPTSVIMAPRSGYLDGSTHEPTLLQASQGHHSRLLSGGGCISRAALSSPASSLGSAGDLSWASSSPDHHHEGEMQECHELPTIGRGKHAIHLWQFLKELLLQPQSYHGCIRWLDRSRGIFKIEDSSRVAKLWGQRKNRPAMNYDKLSRSIRQYYKKGIIKKTENSKRLVYQFQPQYR